ncbi:hypothetical protein LXL04_023468 [Taraxacum kok-saghyz]
MTNSGTPLPPPPPTSQNSNFGLISVLQRQVLTGGANYLDWMRNLRITLRYDDRKYVLDTLIAPIDEFSTEEDIAANRKHVEDSNKVIFDYNLAIDIILNSLTAAYDGFILTYHMHSVEKTVMKLYNMLLTTEAGMKKTGVESSTVTPVLAIQNGGGKKRKRPNPKWKGKAPGGPNHSGGHGNTSVQAVNDTKEAICFYYNIKGHWKRSCPKYMQDLKDGKVKVLRICVVLSVKTKGSNQSCRNECENYLDWMRNLRINLRYDDREYVLDTPIAPIDEFSTEEDIAANRKHVEDSNKLAELFCQKARQEILHIVKSLMMCKLKEGSSVCVHVQQMKSYIDQLENLQVIFDQNLAIDIILNSLTATYDGFILTYHMHSVEKTVMELYNMLQTTEAGIKKTGVESSTVTHVLPIQNGGGKKRKRPNPKWKGKAPGGPNHSGGHGNTSVQAVNDPKEAIYVKTKGSDQSCRNECANYLDWMRNLRITLRYDDREYVLDTPIAPIDEFSTEEDIAANRKHVEDSNKLAELFYQKARKEILHIVKSLMTCKLKEGSSMCVHVQQMKSYIDQLENLQVIFDQNLAIDIILNSLTAAYDGFILTYHMHSVEKTVMELYNKLQTTEAGIKKTGVESSTMTPKLAIQNGGGKKRKRPDPKWKGKAPGGPNHSGGHGNTSVQAVNDPKETICFYCNVIGNWKRRCPKYLQDLKDGKVKVLQICVVLSVKTKGSNQSCRNECANYLDWMRNLRITLRYDDREYVLDTPIAPIDEFSTEEDIAANHKHVEDSNKLAELFCQKARQEILHIVKSWMTCKLKKGSLVCVHVQQMKSYIDQLENLQVIFDQNLAIDIILNSLTAAYDGFILTYHMHIVEKRVMELYNMLQTTEAGIKKTGVESSIVTPKLAIQNGGGKKRKRPNPKWKRKAPGGPNHSGGHGNTSVQAVNDPKEAICFYCNVIGNWKQSYPKYLQDLKDGKVKVLRIFVVLIVKTKGSNQSCRNECANYLDWMRNLRITLRYDDREYVLDTPIAPIDEFSAEEDIAANHKHVEDSNKLAELFCQKARQEILHIVKSLMTCKLKEGSSVCVHVQQMKSYIDQLENLQVIFDQNLAIDIILNSLTAAYDGLILTYHVHSVEKTVMELYNMLQTTEAGIKKTGVESSIVTPKLAIQNGGGKKRKLPNPKWKGKAPGGPNHSGGHGNTSGQAVNDPKEAICFYCNVIGNWKRSYPEYLQDLKDGKVKVLQIFVVLSVKTKGSNQSCRNECANYLDWMRNLRITLRYDDREYVLDTPIAPIDEFSTEEDIAANHKHVKDSNKLAELFCQKARQEILHNVKSLMTCKLKKGSSVCVHVQQMKSYIDQLENLQTGVESSIVTPKLAIQNGGGKKRKRPNPKWKGKAPGGPNHSGGHGNTSVQAVNDPKEAICFYCNVIGNWKQSYPKYLQDLKDGKVKVLQIFVVLSVKTKGSNQSCRNECANYLDWMRNLRITLRYDDREYVLDTPIAPIDEFSTEEDIAANHKHVEDSNKLAELFCQKARQEILHIVKSLMTCKLKEGSSVCVHVQQMKSYIDQLENLQVIFDQNLAIDIILNSLTAAYDGFILTYHMHSVEKMVMEVYNMLQTTEAGIKKTGVESSIVTPKLAIQNGGSKKRKLPNPKWKGKAPGGPNHSGGHGNTSVQAVNDPKEAICFYCNVIGNWKRSYPEYLQDLKDGKVKVLQIFVVLSVKTKGSNQSCRNECANYLDWMRNLRITLRYDDREYVLDTPIAPIDEFSTEEDIAANHKHVEDSKKVSCIMIAAMSPELQKTFENIGLSR